MHGFRIIIGPESIETAGLSHFSGSHPSQVGALTVNCPCCTNQMFPAINLDFSDARLVSLKIWPQRYLNLLFCPFCGFYMKPYWTKYSDQEVKIIGGDRNSNEIMQQIETPYQMRQVALRELTADESPRIDAVRREYLNRSREEGVYHQVGGEPIRGQDVRLNCPGCGKLMSFGGILDYDDLNVPLYESGHRPVALIIGDGNCINWHTCADCLMVGLQWIY